MAGPGVRVPDSMEVEAAAELALAYQLATTTISGRLSAILAHLWRRIDPSDPRGSWAALLPEAEGAFVAAQLAAAGQADAYVARSLAVQGLSPGLAEGLGGRRTAPGDLLVNPAAFAGQAASGLPLQDLLSIPAQRVAAARESGVSVRDARMAGGHALQMYATTEVPDAARLASQVSMSSHHVSGYIRHVGLKCCGRCALLSGRWYRLSSGFQRHPRCVCVHSPAAESTGAPDPMTLFREGRITDLTRADRAAIELGADLYQVVNAQRGGLYVAGGREFTREGTTRRGVAGARMLARRIAEAGGAGPGGTFTNLTVSRREVAAATRKYGPLMARGNPFLRRGPLGGTQQVAGALRVTGRPTVATIMRTSTSPEDARRVLTNFGFLLHPEKAASAAGQLAS